MPLLPLAAAADASKRTRDDVLAHYLHTRLETERLAAPLSDEDQVIQSMPDASPSKWHRAHTTWFFETFLLGQFSGDFEPYDDQFSFLFNSYYDAVGQRHPRPRRGLITRPGCSEISSYRSHVDTRMSAFIFDCDNTIWKEVVPLIDLGIHHEQQHQELMLMDILHGFSCNSLEPAYAGVTPVAASQKVPLTWSEFEGGTYSVGADSEGSFAFDNEGPRHDVLAQPFRLGNRLVTNAEWLSFIDDEGYERPEFWLSDGWATAKQEGWIAPMYWKKSDVDGWTQFSLRGRQPLNLDAPVCHISFYEADAFATWAGNRLPTEVEWEIASIHAETEANLLTSGLLRPQSARPKSGLAQMFGDVWEHTRSSYAPYPGFRPAEGAIGEYNGKFMANQMVLRGGCCVTPGGHIRSTYRNFYYPHQRWMFAGLRLAEDV